MPTFSKDLLSILGCDFLLYFDFVTPPYVYISFSLRLFPEQSTFQRLFRTPVKITGTDLRCKNEFMKFLLYHDSHHHLAKLDTRQCTTALSSGSSFYELFNSICRASLSRVPYYASAFIQRRRHNEVCKALITPAVSGKSYLDIKVHNIFEVIYLQSFRN